MSGQTDSQDRVAAVLAARTAEYGAFEDNAALTASILTAIRGRVPLGDVVVEEMAHMVAHKAARIFVGGHMGDSLVDAEGYLRLALTHAADQGPPVGTTIQRDAAPAQPFWEIIDRASPPSDLSTEPAMEDWLRLIRLLVALRLALYPATGDRYWRLLREAALIGIRP